ncbi:hypothetical protein B0T18DRAFT_419291 [Schizothecium vesticola]|uniref:Uncharacterized protein n=1 Tax=Schizothecium vesticola TaxID=314040 RepID=A0AA40K0F2_9PEZI|nr:hypothetical protein B0T18DRAFT_419291 [Schizothecium vesticola]
MLFRVSNRARQLTKQKLTTTHSPAPPRVQHCHPNAPAPPSGGEVLNAPYRHSPRCECTIGNPLVKLAI